MIPSEAPLVTIGLLAYNRPQMLAKSLDCLISQTYLNLEIIISDDCSANPDVARVAEAYCSKDSRIQYFRQPVNLEAVRNHWYLLNRARGKYFMWAYDDDLYECNLIEVMVSAMESNSNAILCATDIKHIDGNDRVKKVDKLHRLRSDQEWEVVRRLFFSYPISNIYLACLGLFRTELMHQYGLKQDLSCRGYNTNMEVPFLARVSLFGEIISVDSALICYRSHEDSRFVKEKAKIGLIDRFLIKLCIRSKLSALALTADLPIGERVLLLGKVMSSWVIGSARGMAAKILPGRIKLGLKKHIEN